MKYDYFIKRSHISITGLLWIAYAIMIFSLTAFEYSRISYVLFSIIILIILLLLMLWFIRKWNESGLYITNNKLCYKFIKKKTVDSKDICAIKIIKSERIGKYGVYNLKNNGNCLYSVIFLRKIESEMMNCNKGEVMFKSEYRKNVMFSTIFDIKMVKIIKKLNPDIIIMCDDYINVNVKMKMYKIADSKCTILASHF